LLLVGGLISGSPKKYNASAADIQSFMACSPSSSAGCS
jgi:hypothetical protein